MGNRRDLRCIGHKSRSAAQGQIQRGVAQGGGRTRQEDEVYLNHFVMPKLSFPKFSE
jgi:hypothetical protein